MPSPSPPSPAVAALKQEMDHRPPRHGGVSPTWAGTSSYGGMAGPAAAAGLPSGEVAPSGALHPAVEYGVLPSPAVNQEASGTEGERAEDEVSDAAARLQIADEPTLSSVPIKDVKSMLQTGDFEGKQIFYKNKRANEILIYGVIHGTSYLCTCDDCEHKGKALSARVFEQHAVKGSMFLESHNPNDHIFLASNEYSLFEVCRQRKEGVGKAQQENKSMMSNWKPSKKGGSIAHDAFSTRIRTADTSNERLEALETRMERLEALEKRMEQLEALKSKVDTMDQTLEFLSKELLRYQTLVQDISKMLGKFVAAM